MLCFIIALAVVYVVFRLFAPPQAQIALDSARTSDWATVGLGAAFIALLVAL